jgi:hypothetical protein
MFLGEKKLILFGDMIVFWKKKGLSCSMGQLKFLCPKEMIVPRGKKGLSCSLG